MHLPDYSRVVFRKPPLALALAQIRFTPLFRIEDPTRLAAFQESVEAYFPRFEKTAQMGVTITPAGVQAQPGQELLRFSAEDQRTSVVLAPDALTLEIRQFDTIDELKKSFELALGPLIEHFHPPNQLRIGLRFVNEFRHPKGQSASGWKDLLNPELVGLTAHPAFVDSLAESAQQLQLKDDGYTVLLRHGYLPRGTTVPSIDRVGGDFESPFYLLDLDCFREDQPDLQMGAALEQLDGFNAILYRIFRWSLQKELYESFDPIES